MLYFSTRTKARNFAKGTKKVIDLHAKGITNLKGHRWAVKVL